MPLDPLPAGLDDHLLGGDFDGNTSPRVDRGPGGNVDGSVNRRVGSFLGCRCCRSFHAMTLPSFPRPRRWCGDAVAVAARSTVC